MVAEFHDRNEDRSHVTAGARSVPIRHRIVSNAVTPSGSSHPGRRGPQHPGQPAVRLCPPPRAPLAPPPPSASADLPLTRRHLRRPPCLCWGHFLDLTQEHGSVSTAWPSGSLPVTRSTHSARNTRRFRLKRSRPRLHTHAPTPGVDDRAHTAPGEHPRVEAPQRREPFANPRADRSGSRYRCNLHPRPRKTRPTRPRHIAGPPGDWAGA